jgi:hypothetical protein
MDIKLKGWQAVVAIIAIIAFVVLRLNVQTEALASEGVKEVQRWLLLESARAVLPDMEKVMESPQENSEYLERMAHDLQQESFQVLSVTRHGVGDQIVARVEVRHNGSATPGQVDVRYLKMTYSMVTGWRVQREASEWSYYLAAFRF